MSWLVPKTGGPIARGIECKVFVHLRDLCPYGPRPTAIRGSWRLSSVAAVNASVRRSEAVGGMRCEPSLHPVKGAPADASRRGEDRV
jgi:hypothetical protein